MLVTIIPGMDGTGVLLDDLHMALSPHHRTKILSYFECEKTDYDSILLFLLEKMGDEPTILVGESFGGPLAIRIASGNSHVKGLILASTFVSSPIPTLLRRFPSLLGIVKPSCIPRAAIEKVFLGKTASKNLAGRLMDVMKVAGDDRLLGRLHALASLEKEWVRADEVSCPTIVLRGMEDMIVKESLTRELLNIGLNLGCLQGRAGHDLLESAHDILLKGVSEIERAITSQSS